MHKTIYVYVYSRHAKTNGINEYYGELSKGQRCAHFRNIEHPHHWMTSLSNNEGEVRGCAVWFTKPNKKAAIKALDAKDKERAEGLLLRSANLLERMSL